jgi:hypothetical protein
LATIVLAPRVTFAISVALVLAVVGAIVRSWWLRRRAVLQFREKYHGDGKDLLIVYSSSPHWQTLIEEEWIPRWAARAVVLNRSLPRTRGTPEEALWKAYTGDREHTPVAIVVKSRGEPVVVPFFLAFRDRKHGKHVALAEALASLEAVLAESERGEP